MFACDPVDLDFVDAAPVRLDVAVTIRRPSGEVFAAFAHDPAHWGEFFPGFDHSGKYLTDAPHGVGSRRAARFTGVKFEETILVWEEGKRWAFRVDGTQAPLFRAAIEDYTFEPHRGDATTVRWTFAYEPRLAFKLVGPILPHALPLAFGRAGRNLERSRRFPVPPGTP